MVPEQAIGPFRPLALSGADCGAGARWPRGAWRSARPQPGSTPAARGALQARAPPETPRSAARPVEPGRDRAGTTHHPSTAVQETNSRGGRSMAACGEAPGAPVTSRGWSAKRYLRRVLAKHSGAGRKVYEIEIISS